MHHDRDRADDRPHHRPEHDVGRQDGQHPEHDERPDEVHGLQEVRQPEVLHLQEQGVDLGEPFLEGVEGFGRGARGVTDTGASGASVNLRYSWSRTSASSWRACSRSIVALISASVWMTRLLIFSLEASTKACTCQRASSCSFSAASRSSASWVAIALRVAAYSASAAW